MTFDEKVFNYYTEIKSPYDKFMKSSAFILDAYGEEEYKSSIIKWFKDISLQYFGKKDFDRITIDIFFTELFVVRITLKINEVELVFSF